MNLPHMWTIGVLINELMTSDGSDTVSWTANSFDPILQAC